MRGGRGGAAPLLLASACFLFMAGASLGALELARASAQAALAQRALSAGLLAAAAAHGSGGAPCPAFREYAGRNLPVAPPPLLTCSEGGGALHAQVAWAYPFAFLPLPPAQVGAAADWPLPAPARPPG